MNSYAPLQLVQPSPYALRDTDFALLDRSGAFTANAKTELLAGDIYCVNAQHRPHGWVKMRLYDAFSAALRSIGSDLAVVVEVSVALSKHDVPEPDLTVTSEPEGDGLIPGASVVLIVEVSDTTLADDLGRKQAIYASAGVPEYWVADVTGRVIHQMSAPKDGSYMEHKTAEFGALVTAATIPDLTVETTAL